MKSQKERLIDYLLEEKSISQLEALRELGIMRLASRITDLKRDGWSIRSETETVKNRYGEPCRIKRYHLEVKNG